MKTALSILLMAIMATWVHAQDFVTISGKVTDYQGHAVDSCNVIIYNPDFTEAYETYSDRPATTSSRAWPRADMPHWQQCASMNIHACSK